MRAVPSSFPTIAGVILTFVMCYELIQLVTEKNNLHDVDTWMQASSSGIPPLNTLRNARGVGDYEVTGKSQEDVINEILMERRRELWGEGFGITDILRTQKAVERAALSDEMQKTEVDCWQEGGSFEKRNPLGHWFLNFPNGKPFTVNSTYYLYAIPQKEINANPNI